MASKNQNKVDKRGRPSKIVVAVGDSAEKPARSSKADEASNKSGRSNKATEASTKMPSSSHKATEASRTSDRSRKIAEASTKPVRSRKAVEFFKVEMPTKSVSSRKRTAASKSKAVKVSGKKGSKVVSKNNSKNNSKKSKKKGKKKLTEAALARLNRPKLPFRYRKAWEGNSDSDGSVDSGVLDEDLCYECGIDTKDLPPESWSSLIICDTCSAEYHLACVKLEKVPRNSTPFRCPKCFAEEDWFKNFSFKVDDPRFKVPKKKNTKLSICYSPSKPLDLAFEECKAKGLMVVSNVFPKDVMKVLTHGNLTKVTKSGRCSDTWKGAMNEVSDRLKQNVSSDVINRGGRFDMKLPDWVVEELQIPKLLEPILERLKTIMGTPVPCVRTHNVVFAPVGSPAQAWHMDDSMQEGKRFRYFTVLIHLNPIDDECGGTEIWSRKTQRGDMIRGRPGDAFVFHGSLMHRGQSNNGYATHSYSLTHLLTSFTRSSHRFFYYASFSCRYDENNIKNV